jgi:hypothetical protein
MKFRICIQGSICMIGFQPCILMIVGKANSTRLNQDAVDYFSLPNHRTAWRQNWP